MGKIKAHPALRQHQAHVGRCVQESRADGFFNVLTGPELLELTEAHLSEHRERLYPPTVTLSMFIKQSLDEDGSCQTAVNGWAALRVAVARVDRLFGGEKLAHLAPVGKTCDFVGT